MATHMADSASGADLGGAGRAGGSKLKFAGLLVLVMAAEAAAMYVLLPQPAPSALQATKSAASDEESSPANTVEVPIEPAFNVTNSRAAPGSTIHVSFKMVAVVARDQELAFDDAANKVHKARVRQAIVKVARSSSLDDLSDPELSTMKRLIREEINKILRKSYVSEVVISDFKQMEQ